MEDRILRLEGEVSDLKVELAKATTALSTTNKQLESLVGITGELRDALNKGRGAMWLIVGAAGAFGAVVTTMLKKFLGIV